MVRISAACRPQTFSSASEISPTVAFAASGAGQLGQRDVDRRLIPVAAQLLQLGDLLGAHPAVFHLEYLDGVVLVHLVLVDADYRLRTGVDAGLGAGRGLLDAQLRDAVA